MSDTSNTHTTTTTSTTREGDDDDDDVVTAASSTVESEAAAGGVSDAIRSRFVQIVAIAVVKPSGKYAVVSHFREINIQ